MGPPSLLMSFSLHPTIKEREDQVKGKQLCLFTLRPRAHTCTQPSTHLFQIRLSYAHSGPSALTILILSAPHPLFLGCLPVGQLASPGVSLQGSLFPPYFRPTVPTTRPLSLHFQSLPWSSPAATLSPHPDLSFPFWVPIPVSSEKQGSPLSQICRLRFGSLP